MAQPQASEEMPINSDAAGEEEHSDRSTFTLVIVSPSAGVAGPLTFPQVPTKASINDIKSRIRDALPSSPPDTRQRLIHRGRLLATGSETMESVFGEDTLKSQEPQILHLVLTPTASEESPTPTTSATSEPPANTLPRNLPTRLVNPAIDTVQQPLPRRGNAEQLLHEAGEVTQRITQTVEQMRIDSANIQQEMAALQERSRVLRQELGNADPIWTPTQPTQWPRHNPVVQNIIRQQQMARAATGQPGLADWADHRQHNHEHGQHTWAQAPGQTTTTIREGVGPNGERWQVTVNQTITTRVPLAQYGVPDPITDNINAIIRNADRTADRRNRLDGAGPSASADDITRSNITANRHLTQEPSGSSGEAAPSASNASSTSASIQLPIAADGSASVPDNTAIYLLSSPHGPRALLLSNHEAYYTPRAPRRRRQDSPFPAQGQPGAQRAAVRPNGVENWIRNHRPVANEPQNEANPIGGAHANPRAGAVGAQFGQMLWLVIRLGVFVWFFASGDNSWYRLFTISGLAIAVFIYNFGLLNGAAERLWGPIRRHVETLIPLAGPEAARIPAANAVAIRQPLPAVNPPVRRRRGELDEREVAAHLIEQHRQANGSWLMAQVRRIEHAAILFIASLVPGVGERHIAAREAEAAAAEAERQRLVDEATAEAATAEVATAEAERQRAEAAPHGQADIDTSDDHGTARRDQLDIAEGDPLPIPPVISAERDESEDEVPLVDI